MIIRSNPKPTEDQVILDRLAAEVGVPSAEGNSLSFMRMHDFHYNTMAISLYKTFLQAKTNIQSKMMKASAGRRGPKGAVAPRLPP